MKTIATLAATLAMTVVPTGCTARGSAVPVYQAHVAAVHGHDTSAFTEGYYYEDGRISESTGVPGHSDIRIEDPETGLAERRATIDPTLFGEGIVHAGNRIVSLTWQTGVGFTWNPATLERTGTFRYAGEGWGLTRSPAGAIAMSDGTPDIRLLDPTTLRRTSTIRVTAGGVPVDRLNELEWVGNRLLANVWHTDRIAVIDPTSGHVTAWIDCTAIAAQNASPEPEAVLNGIAWDAKGRRLFVTGKFWAHSYEIHVPEIGI